MKKRFIYTLAVFALMLTAVPVKAQIFLDDESMNSRAVPTSNPSLPIIPNLNETFDQFAPLGGELLVLGLLGGAYLIGKKRKDE